MPTGTLPSGVRAAAAAFLVVAAAFAAGTPTLTVYFTPGFDDQAWQNASYKKVAEAWKPAGTPKPGAKCVLIAVVARDGKLTGLRDHMASGDPVWDKSAVDAMKAAAPFAPLPKAWPHASLEVHWHFENKN